MRVAGPCTSFVTVIPHHPTALFHAPYQPTVSNQLCNQTTIQNDCRIPWTKGNVVCQASVPTIQQAAIYTAPSNSTSEIQPILSGPSSMMAIMIHQSPPLDYTQAAQQLFFTAEHHAIYQQPPIPCFTSAPNPFYYYYHNHHPHKLTNQPTLDSSLLMATYYVPAPVAPIIQIGESYLQQQQQLTKSINYDPISLLPIDAQPTLTRQAYGMDKVWRDEFEQIFSQLVPDIYWNLLEVETNPSIRDTEAIIAYKGRYIVVSSNLSNQVTSCADDYEEIDSSSSQGDKEIQQSECCACNEEEVHSKDLDDHEQVKEEAETEALENSDAQSLANSISKDDSANSSSPELRVTEDLSKEETDSNGLLKTESDCDSGAQVDSANGSLSNDTFKTDSLNTLMTEQTSVQVLPQVTHSEQTSVRKFPTRFRMFIDSAKVRFCCEHCGHGWTSMKGRVVFWYELFELIDESHLDEYQYQYQDSEGSPGSSNLIGYCAYKLFGQQCDICKIENRFERPMWYPEEVTKVLHNLYNKIGQVYFGFKMPTIDKQRRAGKPKTSHNSSLCQACHGGVCTDRK